MGYRNLRECLTDLERTGQLVRIDQEVDSDLEVAEIQRRVYAAGGPVVYYSRVRDCRFPLVSNIFGTVERTRYLFRDTIDRVKRLVELKGDPGALLKSPLKNLGLLGTAWSTRPRLVGRGPVTECTAKISDLPAIRNWPDDGGPFITLPQVYTEDPRRPGWRGSNLGMYRVQLGGGRYEVDRQVGLHYQIHRSIGIHHAAAIERGEPLRVVISVGGPPSMAVAAVMPLPGDIPELAFAGALGRRRVRLVGRAGGLPLPAEADFCIIGTIDPQRQLPEGPFGDHLGYYSLVHDFPVLNVEAVHHRRDAVWPFTVVGRPPQEDTSFGELIHELTGPAIPAVVPGVHAVHAVDAAGVHPLLLAIGSERYVPYAGRRQPMELLTCANAILGQGQLSLAKYLLIAAHEDDPELDIHDVTAVLRHVLQRVDWTRDLHFQTATTIDTLDYTGTSLNQGSKLVIAAAGPVRRELPAQLPAGLTLPSEFDKPRVVMPGVLVVEGPSAGETDEMARFVGECRGGHPLNDFPLVVVVDDSEFAARSLEDFLWVTFTRSNPAADIHGVDAFIEDKHWGCRGAMVIDARTKPGHAPPLVEDPRVTRRVDELGAPGGPLHGII
ncbi:MAG: 3-octaprenyl-4-hydroxybenzoate carboxy-lyase [Planctomycetaceae bacterium]|jgi:4-hydroxy-3-polyprenylbenzoate decarboxylase|nr:3-octaprenyl-4-hydroxybenzoate carboxy-lyase [Planctomycetaceae bacterium]MDP7277309.1 UbiD family decarboxylase [Planctomycetaceae bacterium]